MVRLVCDKCGRRGQYRIDRLLEQYGPDIAMPDLRHELAQCPHRRDMSNPCQVNCPIFQMTDLQLAQFVGIGAEAGCRSARFSYVGLGYRQLSIMVCR
jgi:hypothetical protein